jgi:hypothetical protein
VFFLTVWPRSCGEFGRWKVEVEATTTWGTILLTVEG